ncbi:MAG: hypothetical protein HY717_12605 [Planctomycetes bacterium]|nr:hypothetical protein [Planctomycetota bacterium]
MKLGIAIIAAIAAILASLALTEPARCEQDLPENVPVERLVKNMESYIKENPDDPQGFYVLGRVHGLAFTLKRRALATWPHETIQSFIADEDFQKQAAPSPEAGKKEVPLTGAELLDHLSAAVKNFSTAIRLDPKPALYHLGYAGVLEAGSPLAYQVDFMPGLKKGKGSPGEKSPEAEKLVGRLGSPDEKERSEAREKLRQEISSTAESLHQRRSDPNEALRKEIAALLRFYWEEQALAEYLAAYQRAAGKDVKIKEQPLRGLSQLASYEAGKAWLRLAKTHGAAEAEKGPAAQIEKTLKALEGKPPAKRPAPSPR